MYDDAGVQIHHNHLVLIIKAMSCICSISRAEIIIKMGHFVLNWKVVDLILSPHALNDIVATAD